MRGQRFVVALEDRAWIKRFGWRSVEDVLAHASDDVAAISQSSDVVRVRLDSAEGEPSTIFVKRYLYQRRSQRIKQMFRGTLLGRSRARTEYEFLTEMCRRSVPTVRPIAYGEQRLGGFLRSSFVITEGTDGFQSFDLFVLDRLRRRSINRSNRRALVTSLATTIRHMHDAGVRHGGLYWRNLLIREQGDGRYRFMFLDPDTHGRLFDSAVSSSDAVADLSELAASGMAVGLRGGLAGLMKTYCGAPTDSASVRHLMTRVLERARTLAPAEQRRMAVTQTLEWLRERIAGGNQTSGRARTIHSLDEFFGRLTDAATDIDRNVKTGQTIRFSFSGVPGAGGQIERSVVFEGGRLAVRSMCDAKPNLEIRSDQETWLAVMSGEPDAFDRVRAGRLRVYGDTRLLPALLGAVDTPPSVPLCGTNETRSDNGDSSGGQSKSVGAPPSGQRAFGQKYKADDYAEYYARKHDSSLSRRLSNHFERRMIRNALSRIGRRHGFHRVLDCPSGTGRFLPTLAGLDVSVIPMDTSHAMLHEGCKHYRLFRCSPLPAVGSAFELPLADGAVDVVLCARLLHHIPEHSRRVKILREFARVARVGVVISFFDAASLRAWKTRRKARRTGKPSGRHSVSRAECEAEAREAGLTPIGMNALLRYHTPITAAAFLC